MVLLVVVVRAVLLCAGGIKTTPPPCRLLPPLPEDARIAMMQKIMHTHPHPIITATTALTMATVAAGQ